jgi:hypothetical protein
MTNFKGGTNMFRAKHPSRRGDESTTAAGAPTAPPSQPPNLAARMGRWSAAHWKTATFGWLAFVLVAFALGAMVGTKQVDQNAPGSGESGRMQKILDEGFRQPVGENVLVQSRSRRMGDPAFTAAIRDVFARVSGVAAVQNVHKGPISKDRHSALIGFDIRGDREKASQSASSASRARRRESTRRTATISARLERSRCRSP